MFKKFGEYGADREAHTGAMHEHHVGEVRAGYGPCGICGCGGYVGSGGYCGDPVCGHTFEAHS